MYIYVLLEYYIICITWKALKFYEFFKREISRSILLYVGWFDSRIFIKDIVMKLFFFLNIYANDVSKVNESKLFFQVNLILNV